MFYKTLRSDPMRTWADALDVLRVAVRECTTCLAIVEREICRGRRRGEDVRRLSREARERNRTLSSLCEAFRLIGSGALS